MTHSPTNLTRVYVILAIGVMAVAASAIFIRYAQADGIPSLLIAGTRLTLAALLLTPLILTRYRPQLQQLPRRELGFALLSGFFLAIHFAAWITSLEYTSVLVSGVLVTTSPIWVALLEFTVLKTRLPRLVSYGIALAIFGSGLLSFAGQTTGVSLGSRDLIGVVLATLGAIAVAVYLIIGRNLRNRMAFVPYLWLVYGSAGLFLCVVIGIARIPLTGYSALGYAMLLALTIFPQLIGHSALNYAVRYLPATLVSMATQLEPIGASLLAFLLFQEVPLPLQMLGSVVILGGVALANLAQQTKES